jgi:hypothetical protein
MQGLWRITIVLVLAVVASVAAAAKLEARHAINTSACGPLANDPAYTMTTHPQPDPPRSPSGEVLAFLNRQGQPVGGATMCVAVDMVGMPMGMSKYLGHEISPGVYDDSITFGMSGNWAGTLVLSVGGKPVASQAVSYQVH